MIVRDVTYSANLFASAKPGELDDDPIFRWQLAVGSWQLAVGSWQLAVDMIYRGIKCGLMDVWDGSNKTGAGVQKSLELVKKLAQFNPNSDLVELCWFDPEIDATELCNALVKKFNIQKFELGEVCIPFIEEIEVLFECNGVGWSDAPLITLESGAGAES